MIAISLQNRRPGTGGPPRAVRSRRRVLHRRGSLLAEVTMSTVLLVIIMGMTVKVLGWVALERRAAERREQAVVEVANLMERLAAHPYDEVTPELAREYAAPARTARSLPEADLKVDITKSQPGAGRSAKRIAIQLRWRDRGGEWAAPVRLTSWIERRRISP
ncbi:MAG: hypothetical protein ACLQIB_08380 [Isosphaeraceae bacterium]